MVDVYACVLHGANCNKNCQKRHLEISCKQGPHEAKTEATLRGFGKKKKN